MGANDLPPVMRPFFRFLFLSLLLIHVEVVAAIAVRKTKEGREAPCL